MFEIIIIELENDFLKNRYNWNATKSTAGSHNYQV